MGFKITRIAFVGFALTVMLSMFGGSNMRAGINSKHAAYSNLPTLPTPPPIYNAPEQNLGGISVVISQLDTNKCYSDTKAVLMATVSGGTGGPYQYSWSYNNGVSTVSVIHNSVATKDSLKNIGTYGVLLLVTDLGIGGGKVSKTFNMTTISALGAYIDSTATTCPGKCDGKLSASGVGGFGNSDTYSYKWSAGTIDPTDPSGGSIKALCSKTNYTLTVTDQYNCSATLVKTVPAATPMSLNSTVTEVKCNGGNTGQIQLNPSGGHPANIGGTLTYTYAWSNGNKTNAISGLTKGIYSVSVTDSNACQLISADTITEPSKIVVTLATTNVSCNGANNGKATPTVIGGTGIPANYAYNWSNGGNTAVQSTLAGSLLGTTYTLTVTDLNNCTATATDTIFQPNLLSFTSSSFVHTKCYVGCDASVTVVPNGGTSPYVYTWPAPIAGSTATATSVCVGSYTVTVTDSKSCTATTNVTVTTPGVLTPNLTKTDITCAGLCTGVVTATPTGGVPVPAYTYSWAGPSALTFTTATKNALCNGGTYSVTVTDANACTATATIAVTEPLVLTVTLTPTDVKCNGLGNGTITAAPLGGTTPYQYAWSGSAAGQVTATATNLVPGTYTVTVTDASNCSQTATATIKEPVVLSASISLVAPISCNGICDGSIKVTGA